MTTSTKGTQNQSLAIWKVKLELASEGSYQAIQQVKEHILEQTDQQHPIFKQSFYEILQQGYNLHLLEADSTFPRSFETYKDFPLFFLISGSVQVKCINMEGDNQIISKTKSKGLVTVQKPHLIKKFGESNINLVTKFQIYGKQQSILLEILGSNRINEIIQRKQVSEKQLNIMRRFMLFPSKQVVRMTINPTNQEHIKDRIYLMSGKACYYLDDEKQFGRRLILACFQEGYLNPKQFSQQVMKESSDGIIPSSFNILEGKKNEKQGKGQNKLNIKLYIFQQSEIIYLQENFLKDDLIKAYELKRQQHLKQVLDRYRMISRDTQAIQAAQSQLILRFRLNKKQINSHIYRIIVQSKKDKGFLSAKEPLNDKRTKSRNDLTSTTSSIKCSIRIRKSKKVT